MPEEEGETMKNKIFKISIILVMILTMTMTNFIFVGKNLISYAGDNITTNHKNIEFTAYFKNQEGKEVTTLEKLQNEEEAFLYLRFNVKKEGYFNGEIAIENSNFTLKETDSIYVNKIENNTILLNQINVGQGEEIKVKIEPIQKERLELGLLGMTTKVKVTGIYRDSTQKDIRIQADREVTLKLIENNTETNVKNEVKVITNKITKVEGQEKRILQLSYHMGLEENNYPMQEIKARITLPASEGKQVEITPVEYFNNMTNSHYDYKENILEVTLTNEKDDQGKVMWKTQGEENIIITCLYDKDVLINEAEIYAEENVILYNGKELKAKNKVTVGQEEVDAILEIATKSEENIIYKGKLNAGLDRQYQITTQMKVNFAKAVSSIQLTEGNSQYISNEQEQNANVTYQKTIISKEQFDHILGENGRITIYNQEGEIIENVTNVFQRNQEGNFVISYEGKNVSQIRIETTKPEAEGILEMQHTKVIHGKEETEKIKEAISLKDTIMMDEQTVENKIQLEEATTKADLEVNKENLSTVVDNNVELKAVLTSNHEKYDLYKNPEITIALPEQVEKIEINSMELLYENELKIKDYEVNGKTINVSLEGEQTEYKNDTIEGATILMNTNLGIDRKAATKDTEIQMDYANGEVGTIRKAIKIVAPTDITTIYSVPELGIEMLGQEENKQIFIERGREEKQLQASIEVINNQEEAIENVRILGQFPTDQKDNNMGIKILEGIVMNQENIQIYYSENADATDEIDKQENEWVQTINDNSKVRKFLIVINKLESGESIQGGYTYKIPANLDYNQIAKTAYQVKYTDMNTKVENELSSATLDMLTGIGPKVETRLIATTGGKENNNPVRNGEVIRYTIEVANTGTEEVSQVKVTGQVPVGTTMVEPEEDYEYTGASYYQELENRTYEGIIENLRVGEVVKREYEVRVNSGIAEGTVLNNRAEIEYAGTTKQSEEIKKVTAKGDLRISVKRVTDRKVDLYQAGAVRYFAIIENISGQKQENIKVETNFSDNLEAEVVTLITGMDKEDSEENVQTQDLEFKKEMNIGDLEVGEIKVLSYEMLIHIAQSDKNQIDFSVVVKKGQEQYQSNEWKDSVENLDINIEMTADKKEYVKAGETIKYSINIENKIEANTMGLILKDTIPTQLSIEQVKQDGELVEGIEGNHIELPIDLVGNQKTTIEIEAIVDYSQARQKAEAITNRAEVELYGEKVATTAEITHIIQANEEDETTSPENPGQDDNQNNNGNEVENNDIAKGNRTITGVAWYDENANGQKEQGEKLLSNVKVRLLNTQTNHFVKEENGEILEAITNENGIYVLDKVANGKYIVVFDYDNSQYVITRYRVNGVTEAENSKAILSELLIDNERKQMAATDILEVQNNNISNINIGLAPLENFDLALNKYVSKILIQNAKGTTVREYDNETIAKVELDAKTINGSTVIIEYKIAVTNQGEVDGYAKKIADYATSDLKFSSELNKDWYQVGDTLYTESLANEKIKAGETKTVTLTLTKAMTEDNTGLMPNTAEIVEDYNELGIADTNSTPGNRVKEENDFGLAEVMLSIRTGVAMYTTIGIAIAGILAATVVVIIKKRNKEEKE